MKAISVFLFSIALFMALFASTLISLFTNLPNPANSPQDLQSGELLQVVFGSTAWGVFPSFPYEISQLIFTPVLYIAIGALIFTSILSVAKKKISINCYSALFLIAGMSALAYGFTNFPVQETDNVIYGERLSFSIYGLLYASVGSMLLSLIAIWIPAHLPRQPV